MDSMTTFYLNNILDFVCIGIFFKQSAKMAALRCVLPIALKSISMALERRLGTGPNTLNHVEFLRPKVLFQNKVS